MGLAAGHEFHLDMFHFDPVPLDLGQVESKISPNSCLRLSRLHLDSGLPVEPRNKWEACQVLTKSRFAPNDPLPHFLSGRVDEFSSHAEEDEPRESILLLNAGVLVMTAALISIAFTLSSGNPVKVLTDIRASVIDASPLRPDAVQAKRSIRTTANVQASPPAVMVTPTREESSPAVDSAGPKQADAGALLGQFQAWATTQDGPAQDGPAKDGPAPDRSAQDGSIYVARAQPADDDPAQAQVQSQTVRPREVAPAQDAQDDDAPVRTVRRHRLIRPVQNARAEIRSARHALAHRMERARQDRIARAQMRPAQQARAPEPPAQPVQPAQPPSLLQSFGWQPQ